jgi:predicted class III extradiol MEMO1 family dioxygenase
MAARTDVYSELGEEDE